MHLEDDLQLLNSDTIVIPSSPPVIDMPLISSPVAYPPSSSPTVPRPRPKLALDIKSTQTRVVAGFVVDDDDEDEAQEPSRTQEAPQATNRNKLVQRGITKGLFSRHLTKNLTSHSSSIETCAVQKGDESEETQSMDFRMPDLPALAYHDSPPCTSGKQYAIHTCSGSRFQRRSRPASTHTSFERMVAARTATEPGRAERGYYGIDIHKLMEEASKENQSSGTTAPIREVSASIEPRMNPQAKADRKKTMLWTEKYRPKRYMDLVGDERTHRSVLGWLKCWDPIVFPKRTATKTPAKSKAETDEARPHRKILLMAGPPGLGKTTLAHVCARHAGYEVLEINASDDRSREVVKGRIRDSVGTESVKMAATKSVRGKPSKAARPVCVVVDEVDGAYGGAGGSGEGGFISALIDLVHLDQKNSTPSAKPAYGFGKGRKKKARENFRLSRPIILVCNDVYHPALRPLRQSSLAEVVHVRKPLLSQVAPRIQTILQKEGCPCDSDGVRRLCEAVWGISSRRDAMSVGGGVEGDLRGVLVVAEWVAGKLRSSQASSRLASENRLTRRWVEQHVAGDLAHGGVGARSLGRGGAKEAVERIFLEGAGFQRAALDAGRETIRSEVIGNVGVSEMSKKCTMRRLRELVDSSGEVDRIVAGR